jgi:Bacterial regulatory proteins, tetR family
MARWEPNARQRLVLAALDLSAEQGYDTTTVTQIANRAGLTKTTFFRRFLGKPEVLFTGQEARSRLVSSDHIPVRSRPLCLTRTRDHQLCCTRCRSLLSCRPGPDGASGRRRSGSSWLNRPTPIAATNRCITISAATSPHVVCAT